VNPKHRTWAEDIFLTRTSETRAAIQIRGRLVAFRDPKLYLGCVPIPRPGNRGLSRGVLTPRGAF